MIEYHAGAELPALSLWILDDDGTLIDFSSGWTFELKIGLTGQTALLTKTSGITGAAGAGSEPTGTPNLVVAWSAGELALATGTWDLLLKATTGGLDRYFAGSIQILGVIS